MARPEQSRQQPVSRMEDNDQRVLKFFQDVRAVSVFGKDGKRIDEKDITYTYEGMTVTATFNPDKKEENS